MKKLSAALLIYLGLASAALAQPFVPATTNQVAIVGSVGLVRVIQGVPGKSIYVTGLLMFPAATSNVVFSTGTGSACGTGTLYFIGGAAGITFATAQIFAHGVGNGAVFVMPAGNDLCMNITVATAPGAIAYSLQ